MPGKWRSSKLVPSLRNRINDTLEAVSEAGMAKFQASNLFNINMNRATHGSIMTSYHYSST